MNRFLKFYLSVLPIGFMVLLWEPAALKASDESLNHKIYTACLSSSLFNVPKGEESRGEFCRCYAASLVASQEDEPAASPSQRQKFLEYLQAKSGDLRKAEKSLGGGLSRREDYAFNKCVQRFPSSASEAASTPPKGKKSDSDQ